MSELIRGDARKIQSILAEIERRKAAKRDYIFRADQLVVQGGRLVIPAKTFSVGGLSYMSWQEAEAALDASPEAGPIVPQDSTPLPLSKNAVRQLCAFTETPASWVEGLRAKQAAYGDDDRDGDGFGRIADTVLTRLLRLPRQKRDGGFRHGDKRLVRCLDGQVRAVLSDSYRILDNADLFFAACESLREAQARIWNARLTDDSFELVAVSDAVHGEVMRSAAFRPTDDGGQPAPHGWARGGGFSGGGDNRPDDGGDVHRAVCRISNSETGEGGCNVYLGAFRDACNNTCIVTKGLAQVHVGKRLEAGLDGVVFSAETRRAEGEVFWMKVRDTVKTAFCPDRFGKLLAKLSGLASEAVEPEKAVEAVATQYGISDERKASILKALFESRDYTKFGVLQAVTAQAHEADAAGDAEWASQVEMIGGAMAAV